MLYSAMSVNMRYLMQDGSRFSKNQIRIILPPCVGLTPDLLHKIKGVIECPCPDKDIRRFDANLRLFPPFIDNDLCPSTKHIATILLS